MEGVRPRAQDVLSAIALQRDTKTRFWDAMILHAAVESGCETLWSEDLNDGQTKNTKDHKELWTMLFVGFVIFVVFVPEREAWPVKGVRIKPSLRLRTAADRGRTP